MLAAKTITDRPVFAGCIGPYSLAGRLYDLSEIMMLIYINPEAANSLLKKCSDFILRYCMAPVSYTHLDVYKRQELRCDSCPY